MSKRRTVATVPIQFRLEPRQVQAIREAAFARAMKAGTSRPDLSEVMREIVDEWIARQKRPILPR